MRGVPDDVEGAGMAGRERGAGCGELAGCSGDGDDDGKGGVGNQPFIYPCLHVRHWLFLPTTVSPHFGQAMECSSYHDQVICCLNTYKRTSKFGSWMKLTSISSVHVKLQIIPRVICTGSSSE